MENRTLQQVLSSYDLIIPQAVEDKIRTLLEKIHNIEWSGVLFYTYQGSFETNDLVLTCLDVFPMNIGDATFTSFTVNADVASYMIEHDLMDAQMGLVHSHHNMATFFSGTDMDTLYEEGKERNNFLSLIVNNAREYSACITQKEEQFIQKNIRSVRPFFGIKTAGSDLSTEEEQVTVVKYHKLNIIYPTATVPPSLLERIDTLKKEKELEKEKETVSVWRHPLDEETRESALSTYMSKHKEPEKDPVLFEQVPIDSELVDKVVAKLISGNLLANTLPKDLNKALPILDSLWKKYVDNDPNILPDITGMLTDAVLQYMDSNSATELAEACQIRLDDLMTEYGKDFYPYDSIIMSLDNYVQR